MGCQSEVTLGDNLTFSVCTHDPDTGVLTDADSAPTYRIYEDETGTPILTGSMAKLDDAGTTGFYTEQIACTAANGFENDKTYTIYIQATVDSDTGGICYGFLCRTLPADVWSYSSRTLTQSAASVAAAVDGDRISITRGDSLSASITGLGSIANYTKLWFTVKRERNDADTAAILQVVLTNPAAGTDGLLYLNGAAATAAQGSITVDDAAAGDITIAVDEVATAQLADSSCVYDVQVRRSTGAVNTLTEGECDINADISRATS
jgi:hypothetical protein